MWVATVAVASTICGEAATRGWREVDGMLLAPETGELDHAMDPLAQAQFRRVISALRDRQVDVVVVIVPPRPRVVVSPGASTPPPRYWLADRARFTGTLSWFQSAGAHAPDLFALGVEMRDRGAALFRPDDGHFSAAGSLAAAGVIAEEIRGIQAWTWLGQSPRRLAQQGERTSPAGLLARQLAEVCGTKAKAEFRQPHYALDELQVDSSMLLADEPYAEVVMASSSFGHPMYYLPQALEAELGTPVLNFTVAGGHVTSPLRYWLESADYRNHVPDVLVWVFTVTHLFGGTADHSGSLSSAAGFRQLLPLVDGPCEAAEATRTLDVRPNGTLLAPGEAGLSAAGHYLVVEGDPLRASRYAVQITYGSGATERLSLPPDELIPLRERATLEFEQSSGTVEFIRLHVPEGTSLEGVRARVCSYRGASTAR